MRPRLAFIPIRREAFLCSTQNKPYLMRYFSTLVLAILAFGAQAQIASYTFDDASSIDSWQRVADATNEAEASLSWIDGALRIGGQNSDGMGGRAFIFQLIETPDFGGAQDVSVSFDLKSDGIESSAVHCLIEAAGVVQNQFDLQNSINADGFINLSFDLAGLNANGGVFKLEFNFAAGAIQGAGGHILVDNILVEAGSGTDGGSGETSTPLVLTVDVCDATPTTVGIHTNSNGWSDALWAAATSNGDGTWSYTMDPAPTSAFEYLWVVDGQIESLIGAGDCAPVTDGANYANRQWLVGGADQSAVYGSCSDCGDIVEVTTYDVTFKVHTANIIVGPNGMYAGGGFLGTATAYAMTEESEDLWSVTVSVNENSSGHYIFLNSPSHPGDWGTKEQLGGLPRRELR